MVLNKERIIQIVGRVHSDFMMREAAFRNFKRLHKQSMR